MQTTLLIMSGLPFSGKTTIAKQLSAALNIPLLSYDYDIYAKHKTEVPPGISPAKEFDIIEAIAREEIAKKLKRGQSIIYDDLCLEKDDRQKLTQLAKECEVKSILLYVDTPISVIEQRRKKNIELNNRNHISDDKLNLNISLLQPPLPDENAIMITPDTSVVEIVNAIKTRFEN